MLSLKANGNKKTLKDEFVDVKLNELASAYEYINGLSPELKRYLLDNSDDKIDADLLFEYKIHWISLFSDFTKEELRLIPIEGTDATSLSVNWLYEHCEQFLKQPETYVTLKEFKHKSKDYHLIKPLQTISGAEMLFGNANYRQFMLSSQLASMIERNKKKGDGGIGSLIQLFALLYSDGDDSSEDVVRRSKIFSEVNALYGWSAYFFFCRVGREIQRLFPLIYDQEPTSSSTKSVSNTTAKSITIKNHFWEIVAIKVAETGVFNIANVTPIEAVMNERAFDVLKIFNLKLTE